MISIIVPAYNAAHTLGDCLQALQNQTIPQTQYEIIVVDDHSQDATAVIAHKAGVRVISHTQQQGAAAARNTGIHAAAGDIICFTDADCIPTSNWLHEMIALFNRPQIIGGKGIYATHQKTLTARFVQMEYEDKYDLMRHQPTIDFIDTYAAAYRRQVLLDNPFDPHFTYLEDQELSFRLAAQGYQMVFQPTAVVYHHHSASPLAYARKKFIIGCWKRQVVRRYPHRLVKDSHTPQVMKVQMALMALILAAAGAALLFPPAILLLATLTAVFLLTTLPFVRKTWPKDKAVALVSPLMLALRALALGLGYGWSILKPHTIPPLVPDATLTPIETQPDVEAQSGP